MGRRIWRAGRCWNRPSRQDRWGIPESDKGKVRETEKFIESLPLRQLTKQVADTAYNANKTDNLKMIEVARCVRTVHLGPPNTARLPYKMGGTLQRTGLLPHSRWGFSPAGVFAFVAAVRVE